MKSFDSVIYIQETPGAFIWASRLTKIGRSIIEPAPKTHKLLEKTATVAAAFTRDKPNSAVEAPFT